MSDLQEIREALYKQMNADKTMLTKWNRGTYAADKDTVNKFWNYISKSPMVAIVGDYDVDGVCASFIMLKSIREVCPDTKVITRMPRRFTEGYGINATIAEELKGKLPKGSTIITVDNGIAAADVLEDLKNSGYTVLMTDHHALREGGRIPNVDMVIDPSVKEIPSVMPGDYWCGAGVALKMCEQKISKDLKEELSTYAGIATIADVMTLKEGNWGLVRKALRTLNDRHKIPEPLKMLAKGMKQEVGGITESTIGYYLAPAINAPGRLHDRGASEVLKFLYAPTEEGCDEIVNTNEERKAIRDEEVEMAEQYIYENNLQDTCPLYIMIPGLHEGVVGIIAGKIAEEFKRPAFVFTDLADKPGICKGSGRSFGTFNLFNYLVESDNKERESGSPLFERYGGHAGAAGLSMKIENLEKARSYSIPLSEVQEENGIEELKFPIRQDEIPDVNDKIAGFRPFGEGNPAPKFDIDVDVQRNNVKFIGEDKDHLLIQGENRWGQKYKITHFFHLPNELNNPDKFRLEGTIENTAFQGQVTASFNADEAFDIDEERD